LFGGKEGGKERSGGKSGGAQEFSLWANTFLFGPKLGGNMRVKREGGGFEIKISK
jgi:hypothetical protein